MAIGEEPDLAATPEPICAGSSGASRRACCSLPRAQRFSALERPRPALIVGLVAVAFNALANYALIFGKLGMPALGIIGSGLATTLSQTLMCAPSVRGLARSISACAACGCSRCPGGRRRASSWRYGGLACRSER